MFEVFFKQIKQTLQLADFLGHKANAVNWQLWMALLVYVLLRFQAWRTNWAHSFSRLLTLLRAALWQARDLSGLLKRYGTAGVTSAGWTRPARRSSPASSLFSWDSTRKLHPARPRPAPQILHRSFCSSARLPSGKRAQHPLALTLWEYGCENLLT